MTEQKMGKAETFVTKTMNALDNSMNKPIKDNSKVSYRHVLMGTAMLGAVYGTGMDAPEANNLFLGGASALTALGMVSDGKHSLVYHLTTAGARYIDQKADQLKKADLKSKFDNGFKNLRKKANMIVNMARTKANMARNHSQSGNDNTVVNKAFTQELINRKVACRRQLGRMPDVRIHYGKEFFDSGRSGGGHLFFVEAKHQHPSAPKIIYDGRDHAVFIRNPEQKIILDYINPEVRDKLRKAKEVVMVETLLDNIKESYYVNMNIVDNIPIDWSKIGLKSWEEASLK